jgi:hypothetical protein
MEYCLGCGCEIEEGEGLCPNCKPFYEDGVDDLSDDNWAMGTLDVDT